MAFKDTNSANEHFNKIFKGMYNNDVYCKYAQELEGKILNLEIISGYTIDELIRLFLNGSIIKLPIPNVSLKEFLALIDSQNKNEDIELHKLKDCIW